MDKVSHIVKNFELPVSLSVKVHQFIHRHAIKKKFQ